MSISAQALVSPHPGAAPALIDSSISMSFDDFYRQSYESISRALVITLGGADLGREATDEAMTRAYSKWHMVAGYQNPAGWVYKVGLNWGRSWHRKVTRRAAILRQQPPTDIAITAPTADLELEAAMAQLDAKHRGVVVCRYLLDWSTDETAQALDLRPGTVKSRLSTALTQLRNNLSPTPMSTTSRIETDS